MFISSAAKNLILNPLFFSFLIALITTPITIKLAWKFKLLDNPKTRKHPAHLYKKIIPRAGGIPIYLAIFLTTLIFIPLDKHLLGILSGLTLLVIIGILDDRFDLNPYLRLVACFFAAGLVVGSGIGIAFITNPLGGTIRLDQPQIHLYLLGKTRSLWLIADIFALFWIVSMANIVNWAKGFDGQLPGMAAIASLTIAVFSLRYSADITQWPVAILASITAGAYLGFLPFNFYPQKIMPGYGGGTIAGFMIAVLTILSTSKILTGMVVLGIPLIDALYSVSRRLASGRSPVWGDRGHLHHKILDEWHWGKRKAAVFYWAATALLGILALSLDSRHKFYTIVMLIVIIGALFLWFNFWSQKNNS